MDSYYKYQYKYFTIENNDDAKAYLLKHSKNIKALKIDNLPTDKLTRFLEKGDFENIRRIEFGEEIKVTDDLFHTISKNTTFKYLSSIDLFSVSENFNIQSLRYLLDSNTIGFRQDMIHYFVRKPSIHRQYLGGESSLPVSFIKINIGEEDSKNIVLEEFVKARNFWKLPFYVRFDMPFSDRDEKGIKILLLNDEFPFELRKSRLT